MDKYEYKVCVSEINAFIADRQFDRAVEIADTVDWKRVKSVSMLCKISDIYKINGRLEESRDILLLAYDKSPSSRQIISSLCELELRLDEYVRALQFYNEFVQIAPRDPKRYVLQYKLMAAQNVAPEEQIAVLEELKKRDYRERWAYELASMYEKVGLVTKCQEECDELIATFGDGNYVLRALELKKRHTALTPAQSVLYAQLLNGGTAAAVQTPPATPSGSNEDYAKDAACDDVTGYIGDQGTQGPSMQTPDAVAVPVPAAADAQENDIQVKPMDESQFNTMNLQETIAEGLKELIHSEPDEDTLRAQKEARAEAIRKEFENGFDIPAQGESEASGIDENQYAQALKEAQEKKARMMASANAGTATEEPAVEESTASANFAEAPIAEDAAVVEPATEAPTTEAPTASANFAEAPVAEEPIASEVPAEEPTTEEPVAETPIYTSSASTISTASVPSAYENVLAQETDGQYSMVVPDEQVVEKQITGQLDLAGIMSEWERVRRDNEKKREDETRRRVLQNTGPILARFDETSKRGVLEDIETELDAEERKRAVDIPTGGELSDGMTPNERFKIALAQGNAEGNTGLDEDGMYQDSLVRESDATKAWIGRDVEKAVRAEEERQRRIQERRAQEAKALLSEEAKTPVQEIELPEGIAEDLPEETEDTSYAGTAETEDNSYAGTAETEDTSYAGTEYADTADTETADAETATVDAADVEDEVVGAEAVAAETTDNAADYADRNEYNDVRGNREEYADDDQIENDQFENNQVEDDQVEADQMEDDQVEDDRVEEEQDEEPANVSDDMSDTQELPEFLREKYGDPDHLSNEDREQRKHVIDENKKSRHTNSEEDRVRVMTKDEKALFGPYIQESGSRKQIIRAIDSMSLAAYTGNVIVTGEEGAGAQDLAKGLIREVQLTDQNFSGKVAKTTGAVINRKEITPILDKLENGALIIERVSQLSEGSVKGLRRELEKENRGLIVIAIDTKRAMDRFLKHFPSLKENFTARVDIEALDNDSLVEFAKVYARDQEYSIDEFGILALHTRISSLQTIDHNVTVDEVRDIVDDAIYYADRKNLGHFMDIVFHKRYDDEDMIILSEKDFSHY